MKKILIASLFVLSPLFVGATVEETPTPTPEPTPVVDPTPTPEPTPEITPVVKAPVTEVKNQSTSSSGGFRNACYYISAYDKAKCVDSPALQQKFRLDRAFHDYVIGHWFATWRVTWN